MSDIENLPPESRLDIKDVPEQISRIFFGQPGGNRPSYLDDGYGSPLFPPISDPGFPGAGYPIYYQGYADDIKLLIKLGQAALIIFIIFAIISIFFMLATCCMSLIGNKNNDDDKTPAPFTMKMQDTKPGILARIGPSSGSGLARSQGVTNLSIDTEESEDSDDIHVSQEPRVRRPGGDSLDTGRHNHLSSSTSSSSSLSHNRSLPYYEVPTHTRTVPNQHRTHFGSFSPAPVPVMVTSSSMTPASSSMTTSNQRLIV